MTGRKHRRHITQDEAKLWKAVTREFVPLTPSRLTEEAPEELELAPSAMPKPAEGKLSVQAPHHAPAKKQRTKEGPLADFETKRARRLASGRLPIEARLDLHGLRQEEARAALLSFLRRAQASGLRHVKVITGKGTPRTADADLRPFSLFEEGPRGVLREQVPRWLGDAAFRALVVAFTVAGHGHGGGGALYVQVRKKPGAS